MWAVFRREVQSYYFSPVGYAFSGFFLLISGIFFCVYNIFAANDRFGAWLGNITFLFILLVPILTMRLMSEERKNKTDQMMLTAPISLFSIMLGKYLAAVCVFAVTLLVMFIYPIILTVFGDPSWGEIVGGMIGFLLLGSTFISIGLFMSSLSENQVVAAASTFAVLLVLYFVDTIKLNVPGWMGVILGWFSLYSRFGTFANGMFSLASALYYLSVIAVFVFLTIRVVERRRWSEG